jgi:hypothetical protein
MYRDTGNYSQPERPEKPKRQPSPDRVELLVVCALGILMIAGAIFSAVMHGAK